MMAPRVDGQAGTLDKDLGFLTVVAVALLLAATTQACCRVMLDLRVYAALQGFWK